MYNKFSFLLFLFVLLSVHESAAKDGDKFTVDGIKYRVISESEKTCEAGWDLGSDNSKAVSNNYEGEVVIPPFVKGYKVVKISSMAFRVLKYVTSVSIPYTVENIGSNCCYNSPNLKTIKLNCKKIENPYSGFAGNKVIENIVFGDSVTEIGLSLFEGCNGISSVVMGRNIKKIDALAFKGCSKLDNITLPDSLNNIYSGAFAGCSKLSSIILPGNLKYITNDAFEGCTSLKDVRFAYGIESLLLGVTTSSKNQIMFSNCPLKKVFIGRNILLGSANYSPFRNNKNLEEVNIWIDVTELPKGAFYGCSALKTANTFHDFGPGTLKFEAPLRTIPEKAFYGCSSLEYFHIPTTVTSIGEEAFSGCTILETNRLNNVTTIGKRAFYESGINSITIPSSVKSIGESAFAKTKLNTIVFEHSNFDNCNIGSYCFMNCEQLDSVILKSSMTIGYGLFCGCTSLKTVNLPELIKSIPIATFKDCNSLAGYDINSRNKLVTEIGYDAFRNCKNLKQISLPNELKIVESSVFEECTSLENIYLPDSLTTLGSRVFYGCSNLKSLTIPNKVTIIGNDILRGCESLQELISFSNSHINYIPSQPCVALVSPSTIGYYNNANVGPIVELETHEASITLGSTGMFNLSSANRLSESPVMAVNGKVELNGLAPNTSHKIHIEGTAFNHSVKGEIDVKTLPIGIDIELVKATNITLHLKGTYNLGNAVLSSTDFDTYGTGNDVTIKGLYPGESVHATFNVRTSDGSVNSVTKRFQTIPVSVNVKASTTSSSATINGSYSIIDATIEKSGFPENDYQSNTLKINCLDPNTSYNNKYIYVVYTKEGGYASQSVSFKTRELSLTTQQPKVVSLGNVIVQAVTNLDDAEENVGFEWRRTDWTSDFASNSGRAYLYDGTMEGYIRNLNTEKLWKYRPYYESANGNRYYGDWVGIDPTNTSYFEPTVHTYANITVNGNSAAVRGYAQQGSDNIGTRGFKYWQNGNAARGFAPGSGIPKDAMTAEATGTVMEVELTGLNYETEYCYVAFVTTTEEETFYGEVRQFTTGQDLSGIDDTKEEQSPYPIAYYDLHGQRYSTPQPGLNIVLLNNNTTKKVVIRRN